MRPLDTGNPLVIQVVPASPTPGSVITVTVTQFPNPASGTDVFSISATAGAFSSIPTSNTPPSGATSFQFNATLSTSASGTVKIDVSGMGAKGEAAFSV